MGRIEILVQRWIGSSIGINTKRIVGWKGQKDQYWDGKDRKSSIGMDRIERVVQICIGSSVGIQIQREYLDGQDRKSSIGMERMERVVLGQIGQKEYYWDRRDGQDRKDNVGNIQNLQMYLY